MSNYPPQDYPPGYQSPGHPQGGYPPPQPRSGCGGCLGKFLIFLGVIFLLLIAICCGSIYYLKSSVTDQPAEAQAISDEIASFHVPAPLEPEPVVGGRIKVPLTGTLIAQGAVYSDKEHKSILIVGSFGDVFGEQFKDQLLESLESGKFQENSAKPDKNDKREELKDIKTSRVDRMIRGQKAVFNITEGVGVKSGKKRIRVEGTFLGKTGPSILVIEALEETLSKEKVEEFVDSIE